MNFTENDRNLVKMVLYQQEAFAIGCVSECCCRVERKLLKEKNKHLQESEILKSP